MKGQQKRKNRKPSDKGKRKRRARGKRVGFKGGNLSETSW